MVKILTTIISLIAIPVVFVCCFLPGILIFGSMICGAICE